MSTAEPRGSGTESGTIRSDSGPFSMVPLWVLKHKLGSGQLAVYCVLSRYANMGTAYPSVATIGRESGKSRTQVYEALRGLEEKGLLTRKHRFADNGRQTTSEYVLAFHVDPGVTQDQLDLGLDDRGGYGFSDGPEAEYGNPDENEGEGVGCRTGEGAGFPDTRVEEEGVEDNHIRSATHSAPPGHQDYVDALVLAMGGGNGKPLAKRAMGQVVSAAAELRRMGGDLAQVPAKASECSRRHNGILAPGKLVEEWWTLDRPVARNGSHQEGRSLSSMMDFADELDRRGAQR